MNQITPEELAKKFIVDNKQDTNALKENVGSGISDKEENFSYKFATVCCELTAQMINEAPKPSDILHEAIQSFGKAIVELPQSQFAYSIEHLKNLLSNNAELSAVFGPSYLQKSELTNDTREKIAVTINDLEGMTSAKRTVLISVITDFDKISSDDRLPRKPFKS